MKSFIGITISLLIFSAVSTIYLQNDAAQNRLQFEDHAAIIAEDVWAMNESNARTYLMLALKRDYYKSLKIVDTDGNTFLTIINPPLSGLDRLFHSLNLIGIRTLDSHILYNNRSIAKIYGEQYIRAIYPLFNILIFQLFLTLAVLLISALVINRKQLKKQVEERTRNLNESEMRFHNLVNLLPEMVWETDRQGVVTYANKMAFQQLGLTEKSASDVDSGSLWFKSIVSTEQHKAKKYFEEAIQGSSLGLKEFSANNQQGNTFPLLIRTAPIIKGDVIIGARSVAIDITERHNLQDKLKKAEKMKAIGLMAGGVAHDLNNILSGIVTYPDLLLLDLPPDSPLKPQIEAIQRSGLAAANVVSDLLTVARGAAANRETADTCVLVKEYLGSPEHKQLLSYYPNIVLKVLLPENKALLRCSPIHIRKCLMNLVNNAAEAINGTGSVTILVKEKELHSSDTTSLGVKPGRYIIIQISDTGPGIDSTDLEHIFEPFYTKKVMGRSGTGLGLTVVWNTVREHDGAVNVDTSPSGSSFQLFFPAAPPAAEGTSDARESQDSYRGNGEHILIVDDEKQQRQLASSILTSLNYSIDAVSSGEEALNYLKVKNTELVILDMLMEPGMNGRLTYEHILKIDPRQKAIIVSGFSVSEDVKAALNLGAASFLAKPYTITQLGQAVFRALNSTQHKD